MYVYKIYVLWTRGLQCTGWPALATLCQSTSDGRAICHRRRALSGLVGVRLYFFWLVGFFFFFFFSFLFHCFCSFCSCSFCSFCSCYSCSFCSCSSCSSWSCSSCLCCCCCCSCSCSCSCCCCCCGCGCGCGCCCGCSCCGCYLIIFICVCAGQSCWPNTCVLLTHMKLIQDISASIDATQGLIDGWSVFTFRTWYLCLPVWYHPAALSKICLGELALEVCGHAPRHCSDLQGSLGCLAH